MKIERTKLKKSNSELPDSCRQLIEKLNAANDDDSIYNLIKDVQVWEYGKSELYHWVDVLDKFDDIMERSCQSVDDNKWKLACDQPENVQLKQLMLHVIRFTALLIEHSFQRHSYESMDHLITLLSSSDMSVVLEVLNVLYVFSKRSNFFTRLSAPKKKEVVLRLHHLAESWGGKENGFGLAECCQDLSDDNYPATSTTVHFEFYTNRASKVQPSTLCVVHLEEVDKMCDSPADVMTQVLSDYDVPESKHMLLFTHIRLAHAFSNFKQRSSCILARLQAISILVYSHAIDNEEAHQFIYNGFINELVNVLELTSEDLTDMKAAVLRTLTAIIHLERNPKLEVIIDITGAYTYHGFLPSLVRKCILNMVEPEMTAFPHSFSTALFSFLYHLASYESGGDALLSCGIMPSLLRLAAWHSEEQEHITFVTRAVRIIDLMTNMCTQSFETHNGLKVFIDRLQHEVSICRKDQPYVIRPQRLTSIASLDSVAMDVSENIHTELATTSHEQLDNSISQTHQDHSQAYPSGVVDTSSDLSKTDNHDLVDLINSETNSKVSVLPLLRLGVQCLPQRSALLKSILNFFKKVIPEPTLSFADSIRHIMEGSMPKALQHIISNAEYYGASLFLLALDVVTVFVFQEPSLLSSLQDKGLTEVVLNSLLVKDVPATREVLAALPNVFSALCLNQRGLDAFVEYKPFDKLFKVLLSPEYLPAMRKRKSSDAFGDTATNLGTAMDELMRHQPSLRVEAIKAIIGLLKEIIRLGTDSQYTCTSKVVDTSESSTNNASPSTTQNSDVESEDDEEVPEGADVSSTLSVPQQNEEIAATSDENKSTAAKAIPLMDYILNVMKFIDAIMGNTSDDHCQEFINQGGLEPLFVILRLENLPVDFPTSQACQSVSNVCTVLLKLTHEPSVLKEGLKHLSIALSHVDKLYEPLPPPGGSVLLSELVGAVSDIVSINDAVSSSTATPLLHRLAAVQAYAKVFVHMCRFGQLELKQISLDQWGSESGLKTLTELGKLYFALVWEGTVLQALCSDSDLLPADCDFGRADFAKLMHKGATPKDMDTDSNSSVGVTAAMEGLTTTDMTGALLVTDEDTADSAAGETSNSDKKPSAALNGQMKQIKPLLNITNRLGTSLGELFHNVLVKLCVGSVMLRQRRSNHQPPPTPQVPSAKARAISKALCKIAVEGLRWKPSVGADINKLHVSFLMYAVGFCLLMLFEDNKRAYHLMLQEFGNVRGYDIIFEIFSSTIDHLPPLSGFRGASNSNTKLPDYSIEFLDTWLLLAEKLIHPKCIMDTLYLLPAKGTTSDYVPFNPTEHLKSLEKPIFDAIMKLWDQGAVTKTKELDAAHSEQLEQVAVSILSILCHIIQAEKIIKEKEEKQPKVVSQGASTSNQGGLASAAAAAAAAHTGLLNEAVDSDTLRNVRNTQLTKLMDMGFSRERCLEALSFTATLESATEYLLTHMTAGAAAGGQTEEGGMDLTEDEQIRAAIELSLTSVIENETKSEMKQPEQPSTSEPQPGPSKSNTQKEFLSSEDLEGLKASLLSGCMTMLDSMPATVFKICQLLVVVGNRDEEKWRQAMFTQLLLEINDLSSQLSNDVMDCKCGGTQQEVMHYFSKGDCSIKLASRMHLLTLLIQELTTPCINLLQENGFINTILDLVSNCMPALRQAGTSGTPQWLTSLMLIIDQCEKAATASQRKLEAKQVLADSSLWKWFDDRNGRWCNYSSTSGTAIDNAYKNGEASVRFTAGRRKYLVQFNAMIQLNEETGNRRPVMLFIPSKEERDKRKSESPMETETQSLLELQPEQTETLIRCCVDLISIPVECETLHSVLRLCLRCTRLHDMAKVFVSAGGVDKLLSLTQESGFTGFTSICTLLIRHILEDRDTLMQSMEKVVREFAAGIGSNYCGVSSNSMGCKEINYVLRQLGPAMCRNPQLLKTVATDTLRVKLENGKESRWSTVNYPVDLVTANPDKPQTFTPIKASDTVKHIIASLLNILITPYTKEKSTTVTDQPSTASQTNSSTVQENQTVTDLQSPVKMSDSKAETSDKSEKKEEDRKRPLLSKSTVLRMLAEYIQSYPWCVNIVVQHSFIAHQSPLVTESCTALSYIFDKLLPTNQEDGDKDCSSLSRILLASIASCNHSVDAQITLVNELKSALQRTLLLPEVTHKYVHIQSLASLVSTLIEACPGNQPKQPKPPIPAVPPQSMNQMVKLMVKKGVVVDLARVPHSLDLSNPSTVATVNALLRPLETLSRIVNQPQIASPTSNKPNNRPSNNESSNSTEQQNETTENNTTPATGVQQTASNENSEHSGENTATANTSAPQDDQQRAISINDEALDGDMDMEFDVNNENMNSDNNINLTSDGLVVDMNLSLPDDENDEQSILDNVQAQVTEVLEQALDEILSQGRSDHSGDELERGDEDGNMSDVDERHAEHVHNLHHHHEDEIQPFHEDEEDDTTDEDDEDDEEDDENEGEVQNQDGGELGLDDDDDGWSEDDDLGGNRLASILGFGDDNDLFSRLEAYDHLGFETNAINRPRSRLLVAEPGVSDAFRTLPLPLGNQDMDNNDEIVQPLPPAPNPVPMSHPLMNPTVNESSRSQNRFMPGLGRLRRAGNRQERSAADRLTQSLQLIQPQSTFTQRLFGAGVAANILQLTTRLGTGTARLYISDDDPTRYLGRPDEDPFAEYMQDGMDRMKNNGGSGILKSNLPSTMYRWIEECRVLDGPSVHDIVTALKADIIDHLQAEKKKQIELTLSKEKEAKEKKEKDDENKPVSSANATTTSANNTTTSQSELSRNFRTDHGLDSDDDAEAEQQLSARSRHFLNSMEVLFGHADEFADVARLYSRQQELRSLRSLISVPQPQALEQGTARTITSTAPSTTSTAAALTSADNSHANFQALTAGLQSAILSQSAPITSSTTSLSVPVSSVTLPDQTASSNQSNTVAQSQSAAQNQGSSGASVPNGSVPTLPTVPESSVVDQDRACTPPSIFYDSDQPAVPPQAENRPDNPIPTDVLSEETFTADGSVADSNTMQRTPATTAATDNLEHSRTSQAPDTNTNINTINTNTNVPTSSTAGISLLTAELAAASSNTAATSQPNASTESTSTGIATNSASSVAGLEGVDPSFLEALPESIRREVIADQLRLARIQTQARENAALLTASSTIPSNSTSGATSSNQIADVSPEFLAALPPSIQEEVLAVQRAEQARQSATQSGPDNSHDPGGFLNSLPHGLRQQVLADMDDSQISVLPADLMAEAQLLRNEYEDRNRRLQDQLFSGGSTLGSILRRSGWRGSRLSATRYLMRGGANKSNVITRGRQLLDQEALTCLLVLLFLDEPRLNVTRLHRIFKNLGYHSDTLLWIIRALISILNRTTVTLSKGKSPGSPVLSSKQPATQSAWLSFGMDAALGCRANVFQVQHHSSSKKMSSSAGPGGAVSIHPQAAQLVCQHVMDTLIYLGKSFTNQFLPQQPNSNDKDNPKDKDASVRPKPSKSSSNQPQSFWDVLVRLDQMRVTKKGKGVQRLSTGLASSSEDCLPASLVEESPLGQLMSLLSTPVIRRSPTLTDRLLKLLSIISSAIPLSTPTTPVNKSTSTESKASFIEPDKVLLPVQLQLAVEVLTSKSCSEEGLEDSTKFLVRLSNANGLTKEYIIQLLLSGAQEIGKIVKGHIESLNSEAQEYNKKHSASLSGLPSEDSSNDLQALDSTAQVEDNQPSTSAASIAMASTAASSGSSISRGIILDRFQQGSIVTIAPQKNKRSHELQLPSMSQLTAKSSSQQFLLRLLKVIIQLSNKNAGDNKGKQSGSRPPVGSSTLSNDTDGENQSSQQSGAQAMEVDSLETTSTAGTSSVLPNAEKLSLSEKLDLDSLWQTLGSCLTELSVSSDQNAVLILQPAVEAFFLVHAGEKVNTAARSRRAGRQSEDQLSHLNIEDNPASPAASTSESQVNMTKSTDNLPPDTRKFLEFAETHKTVLNQILRQSQTPLSDGPFSVLVDHMKLLDFDVKLRYFRAELQNLDEGSRREDLAVHVKRDQVFEDSYRELFRRTADDWKHRLYIVFEGEEGQDAGGLLREWYVIMSREIFNPNYALFMTTPQDRVTYTINPLSYYNNEHLSYFKFVGRIIAKAIYDNKLLECYFTRSFYKHITGQPVRYTDMEAEDYSFYQGLEFLLNHNVDDLGYDLTFSTEIQEFGVTQTRELKPGGANISVTEENKKEYVKLVCQLKMTGAIRKQLNAFLEGFYDIIPKYLISIFNEQELELLISGLPNVDIDDLKANTEYHKYNTNSLQVVWFWRALRSFDQAERARFLQFVTGTSKVPLQGFAYLEGMNGTQKFQIHRDDRSTDRLPCAHTCFNQLDLPAYETYDKLKKMLLLVINECSEGFGLA